MVPRNNNRNSAPLKIAGLYAVIGALWILYSDRILSANVSDSAMLSQFQTYKGWFFILTTASLLFFLVSHYLADIQQEKRSLEESERYNRALFEQSPIGLALCRMDGRLVDVNPAYAAIIGRTIKETLALNYWDITPKKYAEQEQAQLDSLQETGRYGPYEKEYIHKDGYLVPVRLQGLLIDRGGEQCIWSSIEDITERKRAELILASEKQALEMISQGDALPDTLEKIVLNIESLSQDTIASILLLDADGLHVHYGAAPSLPDAYNRALEGEAIGPRAGSCGTAAYLRKAVIVTDIETDPLWIDYRELARTHGLRACWSTPILSSEGKVLGTFAMYYREPRSPMQEDFELIARTTHIAAIAIERRRTEEAVLQSHERLRRFVDANIVGVVIASPSGGIIETNDYYLHLIGYTREEFEQDLVDWRAITPPEWLPADERAIEELREQGTCTPYEKEYVRRDGTRVSIFLSNAMLPGPDEQIAAFVLDITERKRAEAALRKSEELYRILFKNMLNGFAYCQMLFEDGKPHDYIYLAVNDAFELQTGLKDVVGRKVTEIIPGIREADPQLFEVLGRVAMTGRPEQFEIFLEALQNWFTLSVYSPAHEHFVAVFDVITERKRVEVELRTTNEELLAINRIISTTTTTTIGVKEILEKVMDEALTITGLEGGTICMVTPDNTLHLAAHRATSEATIIDLTTNEIKVGDCLCGECAKDLKPLILPDREAVLKFSTREATRGEDIRFHAAFPLLIGDRCLGVLCVFTRTDKKPAERRLKLLETITSQIAIAVDNAQMLEEISRHAAILENRVKERTSELETKMAEIERMNRLFVGRELRMVELKDKIKELEKKQ